MRTIDIITTQNVSINYELAQVRDRIFANVVDTLCYGIGLLILSSALVSTGIMPGGVFLYLVTLPILLFYHLFCEVFFDGQTIGKRLLGIKVVKLTGTEPSLNDYLMRWALRPIDILFSLGSIGIMLISSTDKAQRLGDMVANTTVVRIKPSQQLQLRDILNIRTLDTYTPVYPQATLFSEQEMLLFKEAMDKYLKYKNDAHDDALVEVCYAAKERMGLDKVPADKVGFVRTLIKDYVALSR